MKLHKGPWDTLRFDHQKIFPMCTWVTPIFFRQMLQVALYSNHNEVSLQTHQKDNITRTDHTSVGGEAGRPGPHVWRG